MAEVSMQEKKGLFGRFLDFIEVAGNRLPHPSTLFAALALMVAVLSAVLAYFNVNVVFDTIKNGQIQKDSVVAVKSLLSAEGFRWILSTMIKNFTGFAPLGTVLVIGLGVGVADYSGLIGTSLKKLVLVTPKQAITAVLVFAGVMSNIASDVGYVILIPLGALIFMAFNRHPLAGIAASFAGVSGGFSANLLIGTLDPLLGGLTQEAGKMLNPDLSISPAANWYFMFVSTFLITILGTIITEKIIEPRLGKYEGNQSHEITDLSEAEKKGLKRAGLSLLIYIILLAITIVPANGILRGANGEILKSPFISNIVVLMTGVFLIPGVVYGMAVGKIKNDSDVANMMSKQMAHMGSYLTMAFFAGQFIAWFNYTNLATVLAVKGAALLKATGFSGTPLIVCFVLLCAFVNLFMGSASAKWGILAPVFVPMFALLGYSPEFTQLAYRIGDSTTNIISPLMSYMAMIIVYCQMYKEDFKMGSIVSLMLPYSIAFLLGWTVLLIGWMVVGAPIGPGVGIFM